VAETVVESGNELKFLGVKIVNWTDFTELVIRFVFNLIIILLIVRGIYYKKTRRKDYLFTYIMFSVIIFLLCYVLGDIKLQLGFAFGLFAIFGIIRYRTDAIPIKEMTYLFLVIGISVINALTVKKVSYAEIVFTNFVILIILYVLENLWLLRHESVKWVRYDRIEMIHPNKREELIKDLEERIGIKISRINIVKIDYLRDVARIDVYYYESDQTSFVKDIASRVDDDD